jgi:hypothetical protein
MVSCPLKKNPSTTSTPLPNTKKEKKKKKFSCLPPALVCLSFEAMHEGKVAFLDQKDKKN